MKKYIFSIILLACFSNVLWPEGFEEVSGDNFGLEEINARKTYPELAEELKEIFLEIDAALLLKKDIDISIDNYNLFDINSPDFTDLKLSDQLKIFKQNYNALNNFTIDSLQLIQDGNNSLNTFYNLQLKLMNTFGELLTEGDRIQKSQEEDLNLALEEIKKSQSTSIMLKQELDVCKGLAEKQQKELEKAVWWKTTGKWIFGGVGVVVGVVGGCFLYKSLSN